MIFIHCSCGIGIPANDLHPEEHRLLADGSSYLSEHWRWRRRRAGLSGFRRRSSSCGRRLPAQLFRPLKRIRTWFGTVKITTGNQRGAGTLERDKQQQNHTFHGRDAIRMTSACQRPRTGENDRCRANRSRRFFHSVRGYGLRTYEPRQGRNAATVV
jgi:hypothetical protein